MKRLFVISAVLVLSLALATGALAQDNQARVRVIHTSPDAPAVDIWVNGNVAFSNIPFTNVTDYANLDPATYNVQVSPTGATEPIVIDADLDLAAGTDYSVAAVGLLANIEPLVLVDNNGAPAAGKAHVRFVHTSPDAPAVDIAVTGGPVLFSNVAFKGASDYLPVDAGTYDLEARLVDGEPALPAVPSVDASYDVAVPATLPTTGGETTNLWLVAALGAGLALIAGGLVLRSRKAEVTIEE